MALYAQETRNGNTVTEDRKTEDTDTADAPSNENKYLEMEIKTSSLAELATWCRSLGLSEGGTKEELSRRVRDYYKLPQPRGANPNQKVITIESAQTSEYFKIESVNEEYARLKGDVKLTLKENDSVHRISAEEVIFNRSRNLINARGDVEYIKETGDSIEIFRGKNITVNVDDWSGVFLDGNTEYTLDKDKTSYLFEGTVISRSNEKVTSLKKAKITNAGNEEALWSINTSRLWLLPGNDFAFMNAVLKVGEIPLLYLPFFYYPADDLIFHPVFGYRDREGGFVQTTTYIIGQPKINPSESNSITKILGDSSDKEKERQGVFLRNTGKKIVNPNALSLRALADYYTNLGGYFAAELYVPKKGILNPLDLSIGFGVTRTVSVANGRYFPLEPNLDGSYDWNKSNMFSFRVPFRYRVNFKSSISAGIADISWDFPYYSDPYVNIDFMKRSESMDWFNMMQRNASDKTTGDEIGSYQWYINGSVNPSFPYLSPYISSISISNISTSLTFKTFRDNDIYQNNKYAPGRYFYAPDRYSIYNFSSAVSGNPYTLGGINSDASEKKEQPFDDPLKDIGNPVSPWTTEENADKNPESEKTLTPPVLTQRFDIPVNGNMKFEIDYRIPIASASELQFLNENWKSFDQAKWGDVRSVLTSFSISRANFNFRLNHSRRLYENVFTFTGNTALRGYTFLNEDAFRIDPNDPNSPLDDARIAAERKLQYSQVNYSTLYAYTGALSPFLQSQVFGNSRLQYGFEGTLVNSKRYIDGDGPELSPQWGGWVKQDLSQGKDILGLTSHQLTANFVASLMEYQQDISIGVNLPPLDTLFSANATFRYWKTITNINFRIKNEDEWTFEPVHFTETFNFNASSGFVYYMILDPVENNNITQITTTLRLSGFTTLFRMEWMPEFNFERDASGNGSWKEKTESNGDLSPSKLRPLELRFSYSRRFLNTDIIKNRLNSSIGLDTTLSYNLQKSTDSRFYFKTDFTFRLTNFMDIELSAVSENNVIFRYFKGISIFDHLTSMYEDGPQNNPFIDLLDSFNFFNKTKRMRSGFKMRSFGFKAIHYLGDWRAELGVNMYPNIFVSQAVPKHITTNISFIVQWKPISEIKTNFGYDGETDKWGKN